MGLLDFSRLFEPTSLYGNGQLPPGFSSMLEQQGLLPPGMEIPMPRPRPAMPPQQMSPQQAPQPGSQAMAFAPPEGEFARGNPNPIEQMMPPQMSPQMGHPQAPQMPQEPSILQRLGNTGGLIGGIANFAGALTGQSGGGIDPATSKGPAGQAYQLMLSKGVDPQTARLMASSKEMATAWMQKNVVGGNKYGLNPIYGKDKDGNTVLLQTSESGDAKQTSIPPGVSISSGVEKVDLGTQWGVLDKKSGNIVGYMPKDVRGEEREKVAGKEDGTAEASLASIESKMPGLEFTVGRLGDLSKKATYTMAGQVIDWTRREAGAQPREAAVARAEYDAIVNNQVLPLLRDTFGAAFTQKEGETLKATLGDVNKSPAEKQAVLDAFIAQKKSDIAALRLRTGRTQPGAAPAAAPAQADPLGIR